MKKVLIASYDIELRDLIKKCLDKFELEIMEAASGISLTYKSIELKPDIIITTFSPATLAASYGIKKERANVPVIILLPPIIALPAGTEIEMTALVKNNLLINLTDPGFKKDLASAVESILGGLAAAKKRPEKKKEELELPSWDDIVNTVSAENGKTSEPSKKTVKEKPVAEPPVQKEPEPEAEPAPGPVKEPAPVIEEKEPEVKIIGLPEEKQQKKAGGKEKEPDEKETLLKARSLIEDLLVGKPKNEKEYNLNKSKEIIDGLLSHPASKLEIVKYEDLPVEKPQDKIPEKEPEKKTPETEPVKPAEIPKYSLKGKKILLADDEVDIRNGIKEVLELEGCIVTAVNGGQELVNTAMTMIPDLIIADVIMPGLSGYRAVGKLKNISSLVNIPVIFMTAKVKDEQLYEALKPKGPSYFMPKTFDMDGLLDKIRSIVEKHEKP